MLAKNKKAKKLNSLAAAKMASAGAHQWRPRNCLIAFTI
jgi:hypothetical protein